MNERPAHSEIANPSSDMSQQSWLMYKRRLFLAVGLVAFLIFLANFVTATLNVLMLLFLCSLIALGLRGISNWLAKHAPLSDNLALGLTVLLIIILLIGSVLLVSTRLVGEFSALGDTLQRSLHQLEDQVSQYSWGQQVLEQLPTGTQIEQQIIGSNATTFASITGVFSSVLSFITSSVIVVFVSLFFAAQPAVYTDNFLRLIPKGRRDRIRQTLEKVAETLQKWLITRCISVVAIGVLTGSGLLLLHVSLALSLGIIAGLAGFIPTFGPILALIPALLVGFIAGPEQTILVFLLYLAVQFVDNYMITPLVQKEMLYLPPAYIIAAQLLFGVVAGSFGLLLAAPIAAALVIIVRMLYVEDVLGDRGHTSEPNEIA